MKIETVTTEDLAMDYFRFGQGERTLVILPGISIKSVMLSAPAVAKEYEVMTRDFTVYVFDRRSYLPEEYTVADMARDTAEAMRALGLRDVCLFGASQGGMIAMLIALDHPELVAKLALGSTAARVEDREFGALERWLTLAQEKDRVGLYLAFGEALYPPAVFEQYRSALIMIAKSVTDEELRRFAILLQGTRGFDVLDRIRELRCPVLAIGAKDDGVLGGDASALIAERLADRPDCEYYCYEGFGHAAFDTAPDYRDRLYRFFMKTTKARKDC